MSKKITNSTHAKIVEDTYDLGIFIFRRDLRIVDNRGLIKLSEKCKNIIPIFIFDPEQIDLNARTANYLSFPALRFICESVHELYDAIKKLKSQMYIFYGNNETVIKYIISMMKKSNSTLSFAFGFNEDFTSYAKKRDEELKDICETNNIPVISSDDDFTLCSMEFLVKADGMPYKQYGAFNKNMLSNKSKFNKINNKKITFYTKKIKFPESITIKDIDLFWKKHIAKDYEPVEHGGRSNALAILNKLKDFNTYNESRDTLSYNTTRISSHLNFGCVSEREFYHGVIEDLGTKSLLINQIIWRDYYITLLRYLDKANSYDLHIDDRFNKLQWLDNYDHSSKTKMKFSSLA